MGKMLSPDLVLQLLNRIAILEDEVRALRTENAALKERVASLEAQLAAARKNSNNSSKPPSSDIINPKPPHHGKKRKPGGQPGHKPNFRVQFALEELDVVHRYEPSSMVCHCGGHLLAHPASDRVQQQIELPEKPLLRIEHRALAYYCNSCGVFHRGELPHAVVRTGFIGRNLASCLAFLKAKSHSSYSALRAFMDEVLGCPVSRGELAKTMNKMSGALRAPYEEVLAEVASQPILNIDETGHKENGDHLWTWAFRARDFALFKISPSRSSSVLKEVLGPDYSGLVGCDCFSAYHKLARESGTKLQLCHAHLIRDIRFLAEYPDEAVKAYGRRLLFILRRLFRLYRLPIEEQDHTHVEKLRRTAARFLRESQHPPPARAAENIANRLREHGESYFRFLDHQGLEPTNNAAERTIRFVVLDRAVTQGTRGLKGRTWSERIWTAVATCAIKKTSLFRFLRQALNAYANSLPAPSLLTL